MNIQKAVLQTFKAHLDNEHKLCFDNFEVLFFENLINFLAC